MVRTWFFVGPRIYYRMLMNKHLRFHAMRCYTLQQIFSSEISQLMSRTHISTKNKKACFNHVVLHFCPEVTLKVVSVIATNYKKLGATLQTIVKSRDYCSFATSNHWHLCHLRSEDEHFNFTFIRNHPFVPIISVQNISHSTKHCSDFLCSVP